MRRALDEIEHERAETLPLRRAEAVERAVAMAGRGGRTAVAEFLGLGVNTIDKMLHLARSGPAVMVRSLPPGTFRRLLAAEVSEVAPLARSQWGALAWLIRGIAFDEMWIDAPGVLLAEEVEDADLDAGFAPARIAAACRSWSRVQALAVIDCCLRSDLDPLPTSTEPGAAGAND
ncbi:hypothetical protein [Amycolatopsis thailandensis]|uniref:hypothetical protein n=1 Tax=Amycolatopsis thailandensis TaxID=589330 RepID=UPI001178AB40|nr:hypothetical protein [Amycolatopsis thailandensis]